MEALPGGKATPGSGCSRRASRKSDGVSPLFRIEAKTTKNQLGIHIERGWLAKIVAESAPTHVPVLMFGFDANTAGLGSENPADYLHGVREDWVAFRRVDAARMMAVVDALRRGDVDAASAAVELLP